MDKKTSLSIIIPTYNCVSLIGRHMDNVMSWADLADEIIVVDSRSNDGTFELIKEKLRHPKLRLIQRGRGLYESWNEGIGETQGKWIYISTVGDTMERAHLIKLMQMGESTQADVVISPFKPVNQIGKPYPESGFTNAGIYEQLSHLGGCVIEPPAAFCFAFQNSKPNALLGSCASDLFRGEFLRARPFPTNYSTHGDTAWTLRHSSEMRICLVPISGSVFCIHPKHANDEIFTIGKVLDEIFRVELINALKNLNSKSTGISFRKEESIKLKKIHRCRRKLRKRGKVNKSILGKWIILTLKYFYLKIYLTMSDINQKKRLNNYIFSVPYDLN